MNKGDGRTIHKYSQKSTIVQTQQQTDNDSCGVFLLHFAQQIFKRYGHFRKVMAIETNVLH